jgi:TPR repeat protein
LAEQGDAFAQYRLGRFYAKQGGPQGPESERWYEHALNGLQRLAEAGNGEAMHVLGVMYAFGRGVKKDTEQARRWLTQAATHEVIAARQVLASLEKHQPAARDPQAFASH